MNKILKFEKREIIKKMLDCALGPGMSMGTNLELRSVSIHFGSLCSLNNSTGFPGPQPHAA